jgi:pseudomonalisin
MRGTIAILAVAVAASVLVSGGAVSHAASAPGTTETPVPMLVTDAIALPPGAGTVALAPTAPIGISLTLAFPHPAALASLLAAIETPGSPGYRVYLTHQQFESSYAPSPTAAATAAGVLAGAGGRDVTVAPDRLSVMAEVPASGVDALFGVRLVAIAGTPGPTVYTALGTPDLPSSLAGLVDGISGLSNAANLRLDLNLESSAPRPVPTAPGSGQFIIENNTTGIPWFVGSDFTQAFKVADLFPGNSSVVNATYPRNVAVATLLASGYNVSGSSVENTPPWDPSVIRAYFNDTLAPAWPHSNITGVPVIVAGITPPLPGPFGTVNDSSLDEFENSLDLEMAGSLAPGAPLYNFYFAGSLLYNGGNSLTDANVAAFFDQDLASALSYNYSPAHLGVVTNSFGISDLNDSTWNAELEEAAATGVTVVAASGDQGSAPDSLTGRGQGQWPIWPATAAFNTTGVLSVGGVSLGVSGTPVGWFNGTDLSVGYDPTFGALTSLTAWWETSGGPGSYVGSEGGISTVYPEPDWQLHSAAQPNIVNATLEQGAGALGRAVPDIAFPGNATIAYVVADARGNIYFSLLEGTSIAAPAFAGFLADEIAVSHHSFGFVAPEIYRMASYYAAHPGPSNPFYDVVNGSNYVFSAEKGWNAVTGWGAPIAPLFYAADTNPAIRNYTYVGPTPGLPPVPPTPGVPWTEIIIIFGVGGAVAVALVVVMARPPKHPDRPAPSSFGTLPPPPPSSFPTSAYAGPTFLCPYCGALRPAEPVRCPRCGAL